MRNLIDFNAVTLHHDRADHVRPGDWFDTKCGIGDYAFARVVSVRFIDNNNPHGKDRVELTLDAASWAVTRTMMVDQMVRFGR
jgi:polyisoprenoid-binding protein YceI